MFACINATFFTEQQIRFEESFPLLGCVAEVQNRVCSCDTKICDEFSGKMTSSVCTSGCGLARHGGLLNLLDVRTRYKSPVDEDCMPQIQIRAQQICRGVGAATSPSSMTTLSGWCVQDVHSDDAASCDETKNLFLFSSCRSRELTAAASPAPSPPIATPFSPPNIVLRTASGTRSAQPSPPRAPVTREISLDDEHTQNVAFLVLLPVAIFIFLVFGLLVYYVKRNQ
ncbi:MAG: hypothetical protein CMM02_00560 [Rhodopirellula sp.]|nr:hypothetical protein [Rhodopirellula sp.]